MITEKRTIKCEAIFNEEHTHRFSWKRIWGKDKGIAAVIMLNPAQSDDIIMDTTSSLVVNNIARLEQYSGVEVLNLWDRHTAARRGFYIRRGHYDRQRFFGQHHYGADANALLHTQGEYGGR